MNLRSFLSNSTPTKDASSLPLMEHCKYKGGISSITHIGDTSVYSRLDTEAVTRNGNTVGFICCDLAAVYNHR